MSFLVICAIVVIIALVLMGMPIALAVFIVGALGYVSHVGIDIFFAWLNTAFYWKLTNYELAVIPMFLLFGELIVASGLAHSLFWLFERLMRNTLGLKGGALYGTVTTSAALGMLGASSLANTSAMTRIARPAMLSMGYPLALVNAVIAASGTLGVLVPPSLVLVIYASLVDVSLIDLFAAAIAPAVFAIVGQLMVTGFICHFRNDVPFHNVKSAQENSLIPFSHADQHTLERENYRHYRRAGVFALMIIFVLGGMFQGLFTPNQAAGVGVFIALIAVLINVKRPWQRFMRIALNVARLTVSIYLILFASEVFSSWLALAGITDYLLYIVNSLDLSAWNVLVVCLIVIVIGGCVMDSLSLMVLLVPIMLPVLLEMEWNIVMSPEQLKIWVGMLVLIVVEVGLITPPFGMNVLLMHQGAHRYTVNKTFYTILPYIAMEVVRVMLLLMYPFWLAVF